MVDSKRAAVGCGFAAPAVSLGAVILATLLAPSETFTWKQYALSDLGRLGAETFWLFNGGLIIGGLIGIPFVWYLFSEARNTLERAGSIAVGIALLGLLFVGVFFLEHTEWYLSTSFHFLAALTFFGMAPIANWVYGTGLILSGDREWGLLTMWFGIVHAMTWLLWIIYVAEVAETSMAWFAVPEMIVALLFGTWVVLAARRFL